MIINSYNYWSAQIGKKLTCIVGLIYYDIKKKAHYDCPQELHLQFNYEKTSIKIVTGIDGASLHIKEGELSGADMGEWGKQIVEDLSFVPIYKNLINKNLTHCYILYSTVDENEIGLKFIFEDQPLIIINLGDEMYILSALDPKIILEEKIQFIDVRLGQ